MDRFPEDPKLPDLEAAKSQFLNVNFSLLRMALRKNTSNRLRAVAFTLLGTLLPKHILKESVVDHVVSALEARLLVGHIRTPTDIAAQIGDFGVLKRDAKVMGEEGQLLELKQGGVVLFATNSADYSGEQTVDNQKPLFGWAVHSLTRVAIQEVDLTWGELAALKKQL